MPSPLNPDAIAHRIKPRCEFLAAHVCTAQALAQLAEAQRELIAKEAERAGLELERNNAQRQHTMQCAINKTDSQRILELTAQLAEAQRDSERLDWMLEQCAYVVSAPECCVGYWLNYPRKDGTLWVQTTEHETPRAAIDAAKGESNA